MLGPDHAVGGYGGTVLTLEVIPLKKLPFLSSARHRNRANGGVGTQPSNQVPVICSLTITGRVVGFAGRMRLSDGCALRLELVAG